MNSPDPSPPAEKPRLTYKEMTWYEAQAAQAARATAGHGEASAVDALMDCERITEIGPLKLKPFTQATLWCLQRLNSPFVADDDGAPKAITAHDLCLAALCYSAPRTVWPMIRAGQTQELEDISYDLALQLTTPLLKAINAYIVSQFKTLSAKEDTDPLALTERSQAPGPPIHAASVRVAGS